MILRAAYDGSIRIGTKIDTRDFQAGLKSIVQSAKTAAGTTARILGNIMRAATGLSKGFFQGMKEELQGSKVKKNIDGIGTAITGLAKRLIIFKLLTQAFSALAKGVKEAFSSYLTADKSLGNAVRSLQASLKTLQGSLASAFAPIAEVVVPWISTMVNWLIAGANAIAQFIAALTGKSVYKKASANIAATGAAAGSAANAVDKLNKKLGAYDDLKVIDQDNGSGGSGGGGAGGAGGGIDYEDVDIASGISDFAEKVKQAWAAADFTEVGTIVGMKLKDALDNINWEEIKATTEKIAKSLATFLNGFIATPGLFNSIGTTIAEGLNTAMTFASTFLNTFDFRQFGQAVMEGIGGFFNTFSWSTLASVFSGWGRGMLEYLTGVIQGIDWKGLPKHIINAIRDFFTGFDWKGLLKSVADLMGAALNALGDTAGALLDIGVGLAKAGWSTLSGWFEDLPENVREATAWITASLKKAWGKVADWFKSLNDDEQSTNQPMVIALLKKAWGKVADWFKSLNDDEQSTNQTMVIALLKKAWGKVADWFKSLNDDEQSTNQTMVIALLKKAWGKVADWFKSLSDDEKATNQTMVTALLKKAWGKVADWFKSLRDDEQATNQTMVTAMLRKAWGRVADWFKSLRDDEKATNQTMVTAILKKGWGKVKDWFNSLSDEAKATNQPMVTALLRKAWSTVANWFSGLKEKEQSTSKEMVTAKIKRGWNSVSAWFDSLSSRARLATKYMVTAMIKRGWDTLQKWVDSLAKPYKSAYVDIEARINSNSRPNAKGGIHYGGREHPISAAAGGGSFSHGSVIVAGERGAEVAGHIHGRTEILNQSQMAAVMYSSVVNGMAAAIGAVIGHMTDCTNAIIANIAFLVESMDYVAAAMPAYAGMNFVPDINRTGAISSGTSLDALAAAVADRISGNIQIENVMNMDGRAVYRGMVEIDRQTVRQTGRSGFGG